MKPRPHLSLSRMPWNQPQGGSTDAPQKVSSNNVRFQTSWNFFGVQDTLHHAHHRSWFQMFVGNISMLPHCKLLQGSSANLLGFFQRCHKAHSFSNLCWLLVDLQGWRFAWKPVIKMHPHHSVQSDRSNVLYLLNKQTNELTNKQNQATNRAIEQPESMAFWGWNYPTKRLFLCRHPPPPQSQQLAPSAPETHRTNGNQARINHLRSPSKKLHQQRSKINIPTDFKNSVSVPVACHVTTLLHLNLRVHNSTSIIHYT